MNKEVTEADFSEFEKSRIMSNQQMKSFWDRLSITQTGRKKINRKNEALRRRVVKRRAANKRAKISRNRNRYLNHG